MKKEMDFTHQYELVSKSEPIAIWEGVYYYKMQYHSDDSSVSAENRDMTAWVTVIESNAGVEMKVVAAQWDETNGASNPVKLYSVSEYAKQLEEDGDEVVVISNAGYFQKSAGTNLPWGVQIIDDKVLQAPSDVAARWCNNWVGITKTEEYVISDPTGYKEAYQGNIKCAVGGEAILVKDGALCYREVVETAKRTLAAITKTGDFVLLTMTVARNFADMVKPLMDLGLDVKDMINLDGGGSATLYVRNGSGELELLYQGEIPERKVIDAIAFVKKKV